MVSRKGGLRLNGTDPRPILELDGARVSGAIRGFVALGIGLRVGCYLLDFPLWWDEAFVAVNLLRRGYLDLLRPLDYGQVCPVLFLWAELTAVRCWGSRSGRSGSFPLACSVAGVVLFRFAAGLVLRGGRSCWRWRSSPSRSTRSGTRPT